MKNIQQMKRLFIHVIAILSAVAVVGCSQEELSPVLVIENPEPLAFNCGEGVIRYEVQNAARGISINAVSDRDWIGNFDYSVEGEIRFSVEDNSGGVRNANVTVTYGPADPVIVTIRQLTVAEAGAARIGIITQGPFTAGAEGGEIVLEYEIENHVPGQEITASSDSKWASHFEYPEYGRILVFPEANFYAEERKAVLTLSYPKADDITVEIVQKASESTEDPFFINVTGVSEVEATVSWFPADKEMTYVNGLTFKSALDAYDGDYEKYIEDDVEYLKGRAEAAGISLSDYLKQVLQTGDKGVKWSALEPATEYCAYAYGLSSDGTVTSRMVVARFTTKSPEQLDCNFSFELESSTASELSVKVLPDNSSVRYYAGIISKADYETAGSDQAIIDKIVDYIDEEIWFNSLYQIWKQWSDFTEAGASVVSAEKLFSDTEYYAYAFGLEEQGLVTTTFQKDLFRTAPLEVTDDCTFEISSEVSTSYMADFVIRPSNPDTKYYVSCLTTDYVLSYSMEDLATILINEADLYGYDWANGQYTFSGEQHLNSYGDLGIMPLAPSSNYTLVLFGTDADGNRTTEVFTEQFRTQVLVPSDMTFGLGVTDVSTSAVTLTCEPSRDDELYVLGCMPVSRYQDYGSDEAAISAVVEYWSNSSMYRVTRSGQQNLTVDIDIFYDRIQPDTDYYVFAFGYMGAVTTGITKMRFTTPASDVPVSDASVSISYEILDGDALVIEDPYTYPPASWSGVAAAKFTISPGEGTAGWYFVTFTNSFGEIYMMPTDELIENVKRYGSYNKREALVKMNWYSSIVAVAVPEDADGVYGKPVIVEVVASYPGAYAVQDMPEMRPLVIENPDLTPKKCDLVQGEFILKGYENALKEDFDSRFDVTRRPAGLSGKPARRIYGIDTMSRPVSSLR